MIKKLSILAALSFALVITTAQASIVINIPSNLTGGDFCSQIAGDWQGATTVMGCHYTGTGTVSNIGNGQFSLDGVMHPAGGTFCLGDQPLSLKGNCDSDHIIINDAASANLKGDITLVNDKLEANLSGTIHIDNIGDIPVSNLKFDKL
jgi:hypothetical protein